MKFLVFVLFINSCASWTMKNDLQIQNDTRRSILLSQFGFYSGGYLEIILSNFTAYSPSGSTLFGFSVERNFCEHSAEPYLYGDGDVCIFKDIQVQTKEIVIFLLDLDKRQLQMKCEGIYNYFNIYTQKHDFDSGIINNCSDLNIPLLSADHNGHTHYSTSFLMEIKSKQKEGFYAFGFHRCPVDETKAVEESQIDFNIEFLEDNPTRMNLLDENETSTSTITTEESHVDININTQPRLPLNIKILPKIKAVDHTTMQEMETTTSIRTTLTTDSTQTNPVEPPKLPISTVTTEETTLLTSSTTTVLSSSTTTQTEETTRLTTSTTVVPSSTTTLESMLPSGTTIQEPTSPISTTIEKPSSPTSTTIEQSSPTTTTIEEPSFATNIATEGSSVPTSITTEPPVDFSMPSNNSTDTLKDEKSSGILYIIMSILFFLVAIIMLVLLIKAGLTHKIHFMMVAVMFLKASVLVLRAGGWYYVRKYRKHSPILDKAYYGVEIARGGFQSITQLLYGTGWDVSKHTLSAKEKIILIIAAPIQILAIAGQVLLPKSQENPANVSNLTTPENAMNVSQLPSIDQIGFNSLANAINISQLPSIDQIGLNSTMIKVQAAATDLLTDFQNSTMYTTFRIMIIVLDWAGTIFMLIPVILTIRQIWARRRSVGRCAMLNRFRVFFVLLLVYMYGTRILLYELETRVPNRWSFVDDLVKEGSTFIFVVLTGIIFGRPLPENSQFSLSVDDDYQNLEENQVYSQLQRSLVRLRLVFVVLALPSSSLCESSSTTKILTDDFRYIDMSSEASEK
ncbi:uncharacterized protein LOC114336998 isoform X1 [Diabrotica virgifera virgifera]|uniref:Uncharacterized protein n=1 Tax=Diabrotica virgifera virgifera TaxID=50390 RepID=A0ABM5IV38_DIAVI|nr:uncharacterized protein LOC114336998 isoform X1 [Diabrotica virgifera virgifera]